MIEQTHEKHCLVSGKPINRLSGTTAGFASQQGSQTSSVILRATPTNTFILHGKNKKFEIVRKLFPYYAQNATRKERCDGKEPFLFTSLERRTTNF